MKTDPQCMQGDKALLGANVSGPGGEARNGETASNLAGDNVVKRLSWFHLDLSSFPHAS